MYSPNLFYLILQRPWSQYVFIILRDYAYNMFKTIYNLLKRVELDLNPGLML